MRRLPFVGATSCRNGKKRDRHAAGATEWDREAISHNLRDVAIVLGVIASICLIAVILLL